MLKYIPIFKKLYNCFNIIFMRKIFYLYLIDTGYTFTKHVLKKFNRFTEFNEIIFFQFFMVASKNVGSSVFNLCKLTERNSYVSLTIHNTLEALFTIQKKKKNISLQTYKVDQHTFLFYRYNLIHVKRKTTVVSPCTYTKKRNTLLSKLIAYSESETE